MFIFELRNMHILISLPFQLDDHQSIEYLSEMRQVTIVFINLVTENVAKHYQLTLLQEVFAAIYASVKKMQGEISTLVTIYRSTNTYEYHTR